MKKLTLLLAFIVSANFLFAQTDSDSSLTRKEKRKAQIAKEFQATKQMLDNRDFVLESYALQNRWGFQRQVSSDLNFVAVDSTEAIIQVGSNSRIGPNGVGGVTARGPITKWKLYQNPKSKSFNLQMTVMTKIGFYDLNFNISADGTADALLTGLTSGQLTFQGNMVPWQDSSVYVGTSL